MKVEIFLNFTDVTMIKPIRIKTCNWKPEFTHFAAVHR